jgi:hypothetical protein
MLWWIDRALGSARRIVGYRLPVDDQVPEAWRGPGGDDDELSAPFTGSERT